MHITSSTNITFTYSKYHFRFYLIYTRPENADSAFKWDDLALKNNTELLANLGNFVNRALKFCKSQFGGNISPAMEDAFGQSDSDKMFLAQVNESLRVYVDCMEKTRQVRQSRHNSTFLGQLILLADISIPCVDTNWTTCHISI